MRTPLLAAVLAGLLAACASNTLKEPDTAMQRLRDFQTEGDTDEVADLGDRIRKSTQLSYEDRAEAAFLAGEAWVVEEELSEAFDDYRWILENAPWSEHVIVIEDRLFTIGRTMLFGEEYSGWFDDRAKGVEVMETLAAHYRASDRADDALKMVGDYFASDDVQAWGEASLSYLRVADDYPASEWSERCLWLAGRCRLREALGPQYDRNELLRAQEILKRSLREHPRGVAAADAKTDLASCREELVQCELIVADFYQGRGVPTGEVIRLVNAAALYPDTEGGKTAAARLVAMGLDPAELARDPRRNSLDTVRFVTPRWEREAEEKRKAERAGVLTPALGDVP